MTQLLVTFYRHRTRPGGVAVSPVSNNLVLPEPDDWDLERQNIIDTDQVLPGSEIAAWLEAFRRLGYCILEPDGPRAPGRAQEAKRPPRKRRRKPREAAVGTFQWAPSASGFLFGSAGQRDLCK
jgi:hypothetical protein